MDAVGKKGEDAACVWLISKGHTVLERNWRGGRCEIDIISADGAGLHFVEVKTRKAPTTADPLVNVTAAKQKHLVQAALQYLHSGGRRFADAEVYFDIVTVILDKDTTHIQYYPQAFIPIYD
jgi:putative endonuclease